MLNNKMSVFYPLQRKLRFCLISLLAVLVSNTASADDIEIYSGVFTAGSTAGTTPAEINPNILFILDTSGSMDSFRLIPAPDIELPANFDPAVDYGEDGAATDDTFIYIYDDDLDYTGEFIRPVQNVCQAYDDYIAANPLNPKFLDRIIQWDGPFGNGRYNWDRDIATSSNDADVVECRDDRGSHGINTASSNKFPHKCRFGCSGSTARYRDFRPDRQSNPYRNNSKQYMIPGNYHDYLETLSSTNIQFGDAGDCDKADDIIQTSTTPPEFGECQKKIEIMKDALTNAINSFKDINLALMRFNTNTDSSSSGGTVIDAIGDINDAPTKANFLTKLSNLNAYGFTPLAESLYEANLYYKGAAKDYGNSGGTGATNTDPVALSGSNYKTPIINECQDNNIILLSDGLPTRDTGADTKISNLIAGSCSGSGSGSCLDDIAGHMRHTDMVPGDGNPNGVRGENNVYTYTIGFAEDNLHLENAANAGRPPGAELGSGYFTPTGLQDLEAAFRRIVGNIQSVSADSFVAPAVTVNAFNRLQHREDIYYMVFAPNQSPRWNGNLKKYRIKINALTNEAEIVDVSNQDAIEEITGFFKETAKSEWSSVVDGNVVELGGAAEKVVTNRDLFGNVSASTAVVKLNTATIDASVDEFINQTVTLNSINIGEFTNGTTTQIQDNREAIAKWTLGLDIDDEHGAGPTGSNFFLGESLHGTPYVLSYGVTEATPLDIIFFASNQGMLHAVAGEDGTEKWAYVPDPSLFQNFGEYYNQTATEHVYGLDSEISFLIERNPSTDVLTKANLFFGQRRGGTKVFAVDVINARTGSNPVSKLWTIEGGITGTDFEQMGQTWAKPIVTKINYCESGVCALRDVLIISGGYDELYDDELADLSVLNGNVKGNAIYIVDAQDGDLLWMAGGSVRNSSRDLVISEMTSSMVSSPTVLDVNKDGAADIMFAVDITGKVFRIDFKATDTDTNEILSTNNVNKVAGGLIADLSETGLNRRFFNPIDVTLLPPATVDGEISSATRFALATGSGYRAHPLNLETFGNRIFVLYDSNIFEPLFDEDLDAGLDGDSNNEAVYLYAESASASPAIIDMDNSDTRLPSANGFFHDLSGIGEKILSPNLISDFLAISTSYIPEAPSTGGAGASAGVCTAGVGNSNVNVLNLLNGNVDVIQLTKPGLTATPVVIYVLEVGPNGEETLRPVVIVGTEIIQDPGLSNLNLGKADKKAWWEKNRAN